MIERGYFPGIVGDVAAMHGRYYGNQWKFAPEFEFEVARELSSFFEHYDPEIDVALSVREGGRTLAFVAISGSRLELFDARLRWFIADDDQRGKGLGHELIAEAIAFCKNAGMRRVALFTFAELAAARKLYGSAGFKLIESKPDTSWGPAIVYEVHELRLA